MNAYPLVYDRRLARPAWGPPFVRARLIVLPLARLDTDVVIAELLSSRGVAAISIANRGDGTGELLLVPSAPLRGQYPFSLAVRYSDSIQHDDDKLDAVALVPGELPITFTEHGTVRVDLPVALAVTPALTDATAYGIDALEAASPPMRVRSVGREERRVDGQAGLVRPVDDPTYLELFVAGEASGEYRLHLPALRTFAGGAFGPTSGTFFARLVKRGFAERTLGPRSAHAHELAPGVVLSALFAEDERAGGRGGSRG